jgi:putative DNA primase/helicase
VLAAATRLTHHGAPMRPAWAAGSTDQLSKFAIVPGVERLVILADNDLDGAGAAAANECRQLWRAAGREASQLMPDKPGTDFNDLVLEKLRAAA